MRLLRFNEFKGLSESLQYHIDNKLSITESIFRIGSEGYADFVNEVRRLHSIGGIELSADDTFIVEKLDTGKTGIHDGKKVKLDSPTRISDGDHKFQVFRDSGKKNADGEIIAKRIAWGDPNSTIKNDDDAARESFLARHKCSEKTLEKDGMDAGWWACNVHRFWKQLGLSSDKPW